MTEEEKSVFKGFAKSGELNQFSYSKQTAGLEDNSSPKVNQMIGKELTNALSKETPAATSKIANSNTTNQNRVEKVDFESSQLIENNNEIKTVEISGSEKTNNAAGKMKVSTGNESAVITESNVASEVVESKPGKISQKEQVKSTLEIKEKPLVEVKNTCIEKESDELSSSETKTTEQSGNYETKPSKISVKGSVKSTLKVEPKSGVEVKNIDIPKESEESESAKIKTAEKPVSSTKPQTTEKKLNGASIEFSEKAINSENSGKSIQNSDKKFIVNENQIVKEDKQNTSSDITEFKKTEKVEIDVKKLSTSVEKESNSEEKVPVQKEHRIKAAKENESEPKAFETFKTENAKMKAEAGLAQETNTKTNAKDEKITAGKEEVGSKEVKISDDKTVKNETRDGRSNTSQENDSSSKNNHETFKNNLTSSLTNEFDIEKLKTPAETKPLHESLKTIKQSEIIPTFSKLIQQGEKQSMTFQLTPENLGKVTLVIDLVQNQVQTSIEVENQQVKQFIQANIEQLKQNMQANGIQLSNVNVSLADYSQKNSSNKTFAPKKKTILGGAKEIATEEITDTKSRKMGYSTYEFLA